MKKIGFIASLICLCSFALSRFTQTGNASYYSSKFHGRKTASGVIFHKDSLYCAHKSLKFGTFLRVRNIKNDSVVILRVVDRMGKSPHIIDVSLAAAKKLNFIHAGIAKVDVEEFVSKSE